MTNRRNLVPCGVLENFNPTLIKDGLPLLETQFGLKADELDTFQDDRQEMILSALDIHMWEISTESRRNLANVITFARAIAG